MEKGKRNTNFELLRIISMLLIVLHHYSLYSGLINIDTNNINKIIGIIINLGGKLGAITFILITGYFTYESKFKIKKMLMIAFEVIFYSITIYILMVVFGKIQFSIKELVKNFFPIIYMRYWFVTYYIGIYLFSPFINRLVRNLKYRELKILILIGSITFVFIPTIFIKGDLFYNGFSYLVLMYMIGAYIRKYDIKIDNKKINIALIVLITALVAISIVSMLLSVRFPALSAGMTYLSKGNSVFVFLIAILIFLKFKSLDIKNNNFILFLGGTSFAVYLISDNPNLRNYLWNEVYMANNYINKDWYLLILNITFSVITIYLVCSIIEFVRKYTIEKFFLKLKFINYFCEKIDKKIKIDDGQEKK